MSTPDPAAAAGARSRASGAVMPDAAEAPGLGPVSERVAAAVLAHPAVAALSGGPLGTIATYLPGRRLVGVVVGEPGEVTRISVVLHLGPPIPRTAAELRGIVAAETGAERVDVVVTDLAVPEPEPAAASPVARPVARSVPASGSR